MRQTTFAKPAEVERTWYVVDGTGKTLGRLATEVASVLRGKNKPTYTPNVDCGDFVIVINADKIELTGNKLDTKKYYNHSGYAGSHLATDIRSERQDSHRFWNSGRSYRATCHAIVFQKETEDGTLQ